MSTDINNQLRIALKRFFDPAVWVYEKWEHARDVATGHYNVSWWRRFGSSTLFAIGSVVAGIIVTAGLVIIFGMFHAVVEWLLNFGVVVTLAAVFILTVILVALLVMVLSNRL